MAFGPLVAGVTVTCPTGFATDAVYAVYMVSPGTKASFSATAVPSSSASARPLSVASADSSADSWTVTWAPAPSSGNPSGTGQR